MLSDVLQYAGFEMITIIKHLQRFHGRFIKFLKSLFGRKTDIKLGLYGPTNSGKSTLANRISTDWIGEEISKVSPIPHETREVILKEKIVMESSGKKLEFSLVDTPGIATKIDFEDFVRFGVRKKEAKKRAKEATKGVVDAIKWLDKMDLVIVVMDATKNPVDQVNVTLLGNLEARGIPVIIAANKIDLRKSDVLSIRNAFPGYKAVGISAKKGQNIKHLYKMIADSI